MKVTVSIEEYREHAEAFDGICLACGEWSEGGVEPDAGGYLCDYCGANAVCGAEDAMMMDSIKVEG